MEAQEKEEDEASLQQRIKYYKKKNSGKHTRAGTGWPCVPSKWSNGATKVAVKWKDSEKALGVALYSFLNWKKLWRLVSNEEDNNSSSFPSFLLLPLLHPLLLPLLLARLLSHPSSPSFFPILLPSFFPSFLHGFFFRFFIYTIVFIFLISSKIRGAHGTRVMRAGEVIKKKAN